jgi:sporulation protein YlmC with PRC-barrel domain
MLRSIKNLEGFAVCASDGTIGHVTDFYIDDKTWAVRYLIVDTGSWLSSRKVLISPVAVDHPDWTGKVLPVSLTKEQVKNSPDIDTDKPVSRQHERQYLGYYGYPYYWAGDGLWGPGAYPGMMLMGLGEGGSDSAYGHAQAQDARAEDEGEESGYGDPRLRSCNALMKYHVEASDGGIGHVQGLLLDDDTWAIRYLVVDTSNWWLGHQVLIAPRWIQGINWLDATVSVTQTQQAVKNAPPYNSAVPFSRDQEMALYEHHGRAGYWADEVNLSNPQFRAREKRPSL